MTLSAHEERLYRALFLTAEDAPGLDAREAVHQEEAETEDEAWERCHGIKAGFQVWQRLEGTDLKRLVDVRWLFPSGDDARRYHALRMAVNAEGLRREAGFRIPGADIAAFSGEVPLGLGGTMELYLFAMERVCAKVFLTGLDEAARLGILKRAAGRIGRALQPG